MPVLSIITNRLAIVSGLIWGDCQQSVAKTLRELFISIRLAIPLKKRE